MTGAYGREVEPLRLLGPIEGERRVRVLEAEPTRGLCRSLQYTSLSGYTEHAACIGVAQS